MNSSEQTLQQTILEAAEEIAPGSIPPLRLRERPDARFVAGSRRHARRLGTALAPLAAAASVVAVTAAVLAVNGLHGQHRTGPGHAHRFAHKTRAPDPGAPPPPYYVTLTGITYPWYDNPLDATIRATASGRALATIRPPAPYATFSAVAGALSDGTFVLGAQRWQPQSNSAYVNNNSMASVRFFQLRIGPTGTTFQLTPLPVADVNAPAQEESAALSPDGTRLAVAVATPGSAGHAASQQIRVYDLGSATGRTWSATGPAAARATIGTLSWADDDRTVAFNWWGETAGLRLLRTDTPGSDLLASSQGVQPGASAGPECQGDAILTPDGTTIVCPAITNPIRSPRPGTHSRAAAAERLRRITHGKLSGPAVFRQGYAEFSASSGKLLRILGRFQYGHNRVDDNGSPLLLWTNSTGGTLIVQDFYPNPLVAIVSPHNYKPIPWSNRISAGQGSVSEAAW